MARVAEQHDASLAPFRERLALENRPLVAIGARIEHGANIRMKSFVRLAQLAHVARRGPRFAGEPVGRLRDARHEIDLAAIAPRVIDDDVPVDAPPLRA